MRSDPAFFHDAETHQLVETLAHTRKLTIFAGSGTTIDKSGVDWFGLVDGLLQPYIPDPETRSRLISQQGPLQAASAAVQLFISEYGDLYQTRLNNELRRILYRLASDVGGRLSLAIASLAVQRRARGLGTVVATPNFDSYVEEDIRKLAEELLLVDDPGLSDAALERGVKRFVRTHVRYGDDEVPNPFRRVRLFGRIIDICYIHGAVPEVGEVLVQPVVSEADYLNAEARSVRVLQTLFADSTVLLIGSAVTDPPLLRALHLTVESREHGRFAVLPLEGREWQSCADASQLSELKWFAQERLEHFGVVPVFPDFFFQSAQLLIEARVCGDAGRGSYSGEHNEVRYGHRLEKWWSQWEARFASVQLPRLQDEHHSAVRESLTLVREHLRAPSREPIKLEVWLRWAPGEHSRMLRLWASSTASLRDTTTMRDADITNSSEYASMRIFCEGRPQSMEALSSRDRWRTYFGTPIYFGEALKEVPVGVITLASQRQRSESCLTPVNRARWPQVVTELRSLGRLVAGLADRNL